MSKKTMTNEFLVRYLEDFDKYSSIIETSCKKWNSVARNQLKRRIKLSEDVWENENKKTKSFTVNFQNGSKAYFLFIPKNITVYDIHNEIKEEFKEGIKEHLTISFNLLELSEEHQKILISALSGAVYLYQWDYPKYGKKTINKNKKENKDFGFYTSISKEETNKIIKEGELIAKGTNLVRTLALMPTNYMTSKHLINEAKEVAKNLKRTKFIFLNEEKLKKMGAECFLSVLRGSKGSKGGLVNITYRTRAKNAPNIAIIGKGVTFDTGGYNTKGDDMGGMHRDMTGAAVALALFESLVKNQIRANLDLYLAIGENLVSEMAYKPHEVVSTLNGVTIEVKNTDSEGRMLLVDTIIYAKAINPDLIIDFATLTGGAILAIDTRYSCVFSNYPELGLKAVKAGENSGERVWNFPTTNDFTDLLLQSNIADILQCIDDENADHIYAACLLQFFVGDIPWIHVDLSSEYCDNGLGLVDTDVTGFGVRWGFEFIQKYLLDYIKGD